MFLKPIKDVPYGPIANATLIGFMSSCILPLRPGEIIRPYLLHRQAGVSFGSAAGTAMGLERVFDLIGVCFLLLLTMVLISAGAAIVPAAGSAPGSFAQDVPAAAVELDTGLTEDGGTLAAIAEDIRLRSVWFAAVTLLGLAGLLAVAFFPRLVSKVAGLCLNRAPRAWRARLRAFVESVTQAMSFLRSPRRVAAGLFLTMLIWILITLCTYSLAQGFRIGLSFAGVLLVQVIVTAGVALPQAPSFIGVFQVAAIKGVQLCSAAQWSEATAASAAAFAMMLWVVNVVPITIVGLGVLRRQGLGLLQLARASEEAASAAE
jgi:uncharacterized membrane protein YbhN (UPF0104 family)